MDTGWYNTRTGEYLKGVHTALLDTFRQRSEHARSLRGHHLTDHLFATGWIRVTAGGVQIQSTTSLQGLKDFLVEHAAGMDRVVLDMFMHRHHSGLIDINTVIEADSFENIALALR